MKPNYELCPEIPLSNCVAPPPGFIVQEKKKNFMAWKVYGLIFFKYRDSQSLSFEAAEAWSSVIDYIDQQI